MYDVINIVRGFTTSHGQEDSQIEAEKINVLSCTYF